MDIEIIIDKYERLIEYSSHEYNKLYEMKGEIITITRDELDKYPFEVINSVKSDHNKYLIIDVDQYSLGVLNIKVAKIK